MSFKFETKDQEWIDAAKTDEMKVARSAALLNLIEMNGLNYEPGIGKSYIPEKNYYVRFDDSSLTPAINELYEKALNYVALGGGLGGLAGCGVRWGVRKYYELKRETRTFVAVNDEAEDAVKAFTAFAHAHKESVPFWTAQAMNVLGLAGAIFNREMHHWNAENTNPQKALLGALGQTDEIPEQEYRKLFYLSIHPVPLAQLENVRQSIVEGTIAGISDAVTTRCRSAPAGFGDIHACAQGAIDLRAEEFYGKFGEKIQSAIDDLIDINDQIMSNAGSYHVFAPAYNKKRITLEKARYRRAMICAAAYIIVHVKGSLVKSAALKKFRNSNLRMIQKWVAAYEKVAEVEGVTLVDLAKD